MKSDRKLLVLMSCGLIVLCPLLMAGCTTNILHPSCGGQYGTSIFSVGWEIRHNVSLSDPHLENWTHARFTTTIFLGAVKLIQLNHTYHSQFPGTGMTTLYYVKANNATSKSYQLTLNQKTAFTITIAITSDDPAVSGTMLFNGTNSLTGTIVVRDIGLDNHNIVSDIELDKADPNIKIPLEKAPSVQLRSSDWSYDVMHHSHLTSTC